MLNRLRPALPAAAGPLVLAAHLCAEALVSGRSLYSVAAEPLHAYLFLLAVLSTPFWTFAARRRCLRLTLLATLGLTLALEGNGLGRLSLIGALLLGSFLVWLGGLAIERVAVARAIPPTRVLRCVQRVVALGHPPVYGPYFAFVPIRGNRPPPQLL
jgi:hypothetical protein